MEDQCGSGLDFPTSANIDIPPSYESVVSIGQTDLEMTHDAVPRSVSPALQNTADASESATQTVVRFLGSCSTSESASTLVQQHQKCCLWTPGPWTVLHHPTPHKQWLCSWGPAAPVKAFLPTQQLLKYCLSQLPARLMNPRHRTPVRLCLWLEHRL